MTRPLLPTDDLPARIADAVAFLRERTALVPRVGLTLGSGLGGVVDAVAGAEVVSTRDIPHWPASTVAGHAGRVAIGTWEGVPIVALAGRSHRYEGYALDRVTFGVRVMRALGARTMVFTNAVGAIHPELAPGDIMLATGHVNFIGKRGLFTGDELRERRAGRAVGEPYDPTLAGALRVAASEVGVRMASGTLMGGHGPTYETAAEVRMARRLGADVACMSTVHEVTLAAQLGCACASLSCVTNKATGIAAGPLHHSEVTEVADRVASGMRAILGTWLRRMAKA